jgi:phospholipid/cholesterol/gamma-HCH transport system permease protein
MIALLNLFGDLGFFVRRNLSSLSLATCIFAAIITRSGFLLKRPRLVIDQILFVGNHSFVIIAVSGLFVGFALSLQGYYTLNRYGSEQALCLLATLSLTREFGLVITALLFAGRASTSLIVEIGLMKAVEQLTAMEMMAVDPLGRVIAPRLWADMISMPILATIFTAVGVLGGYLVGVLLISVDSGAFWSQMQGGVDLFSDIGNGLIKSMVFGVAVAFIALYWDYESKSTPKGLSQATTRTVDFFFIGLGAGFLLTAMMFSN